MIAWVMVDDHPSTIIAARRQSRARERWVNDPMTEVSVEPELVLRSLVVPEIVDVIRLRYVGEDFADSARQAALDTRDAINRFR